MQVVRGLGVSGSGQLSRACDLGQGGLLHSGTEIIVPRYCSFTIAFVNKVTVALLSHRCIGIRYEGD